MNIQARTVTNRRPARRRQNTSEASWGRTFYTILYLLLIVVTICGIANYRISLNSRTTALNQEIDRVKREISELDQDIQRLKIDREKFSGREYINSQIARYNLKLRPPEPDQTRHLTVYYRHAGSRRTNSGTAALRGQDSARQLSLNRR